MEILLASVGLIAFCTSLSALEEHIRWMDFYNKDGEEDCEYHVNKHHNYDIGYHE